VTPGSTAPTIAQVAALCRELDMKVREYTDLVRERANAEVDYKASRARRILQARTEGAKSVAEAETIASADPVIEELYRRHLVADGMADACARSIAALRERIGFGRSVISSERAADMLHAQGVGGAA
jgi:hypothetical protein